MFTSIERYSQLRNYFIGCHKTALVEIWTSLHDPAKSLMSYLPSFYDELLSRWHSEYTWCSQVFSDPLDLLSQLFSGALESLESQISRCLQASLQSSSLSTLTDARQQALKFVKGLEKMISEVPMPSPPLPSLFSLVEAVHAPFCQLLVRYPNLEQQSLTHTLKDMQLYTAAPEDTVSSLSSSIPKVLHSAAQALERCVQLTEGWGTAGLVRALEAFFTQYLSKLSSTVNSLRGSCGLGTRAGGGGASRGEDWAYLQVAFALIQCCGELLLRSEGLNMQVSDCLSSRAASLTSPADQSNPFGLYDYLLVYHPEEHTATMELLTAVEKGGSGGHQLLVRTNKLIHSLNAQAHTFAFDLLFLKLKQKLSNFPKLKVWETGVVSPLESPRALTDDLPSFTLSPLPYITEIGDYLLTLPQQLEPFTSQESPALSAALKQSHLPFPPTDGVAADEREGEEHPSDAWLGAVARGTMSTYMTNILQIPSLSQQAATQLATDISYLCNVLAALGQSPIKQLTQLESLIKATRDEFIGFEKYETIPRQLYQAMAGIRTWHE
ncbi:Conserved oligomeric Golgi complex subunit 7 [Geodia barretti]|uniref:Conserved oligomeric Golgi complex subunit 7 n=4 Tax=Geodia barretti TaxID=519541 RepID=A0AA35WQD0_GEOBA|nr:Conserved oligomeric Golgi complex subunit 7 [Geodia barretti]